MNALDRAAILSSLLKAIDAVNAQLPKGKKLEKSVDLVLVGSGSTVDSLMLMNLVIEIESRLADDFGADIPLADVVAFPVEQNPFRTLGTLADDLVVRVAIRSNAPQEPVA